VPFAQEVLNRYWRMGQDLGSTESVAEVAPQIGLETAALRVGIDSDTARNDLREAVAGSLERGVFGSPFFIVDGEPFWGSDRLEQVEDWLSTGGW
jgi:2-hydroxychromene-2-carboxylate isomerase